MADPRIDRLAAVLVDYSGAARAGDLVLVESSALAAPLVRAVYERVLAAGGHPETRIFVDGEAERLFELGTDAQLEWLSPARIEEVERADVRIRVAADGNTRALAGVDPAREARAQRARRRLSDRLLERAAKGELRWVLTLFPTNASAQDAGMSLAEYEDFVFRAGFLDRDDPVAAWRELGERIGRLAGWLRRKDSLRVLGDGVDLTVGVGGRTWIPSSGKENFPDGEVFTGPVETRVDGEIEFSFPASFRGRIVEGVSLRFRDGEIVAARAKRGDDFLQEMLAIDDGARRVGEFAFGLNDAVSEFTLNTLFDEKIGGTIHLALGKSFPETGGKNASALHWDLVRDLRTGSEVHADGEVVYRDGRFLDGLF